MSSAPLANVERNAGPSQAIQLRQDQWHDPEWQRLWLSVESRPWRSLALIPAGDGASADFTLIIAITLSRTGMVHLGRPLQVADATQVPLNQLTAFTAEVKRCTDSGQRLLVALPPTTQSAITTSIAQFVDAAVLCVLSEGMSSAQAKRTVKLVGASRFLGSAVFHPSKLSTPP
ncbi:MAG TPA: hypothetical protein VER96_32700 [Polyangiaceae bacterium]|nr:hypothetical protein [Polyangiaceae bacterium]